MGKVFAALELYWFFDVEQRERALKVAHKLVEHDSIFLIQVRKFFTWVFWSFINDLSGGMQAKVQRKSLS